MIWNSKLQNAHAAEIPTFLSVASAVGFFLLCSVLISFKFRKLFLQFSEILRMYNQYDENWFATGIS